MNICGIFHRAKTMAVDKILKLISGTKLRLQKGHGVVSAVLS